MIKIYEKGKLTKEFLQYVISEGLPEDLLPYWSDYFGYRCDWNIIGGQEAQEIFEPYYKYNPESKEEWYYDNRLTLEQKWSVVKWLSRTTEKIFKVETMLKSSIDHDKVQLRIATTMIDKLEIPKIYRDMLFDNMVYTYWVRKRAYDAFFCKEIMQFPFAPDFHIPVVKGGED